MKKIPKGLVGKPVVLRNFVAKHSSQVNRPQVFKDKKKDYKRSPKHRNRDFGDLLLIA